MKKRQEVYDLYWYFACERQNIFWKKINGESAPWTNDKILQEYKFCNSYRVNDRVSQYLLKNVIYNGKKYSGKIKSGNKKDILGQLDISVSRLKNKKYRINIDIKTRKLYEPVLYETYDAYYISLAIPRNIYDKIVVIDAGHGGIDEGTVSADGKYYEKDY